MIVARCSAWIEIVLVLGRTRRRRKNTSLGWKDSSRSWRQSIHSRPEQDLRASGGSKQIRTENTYVGFVVHGIGEAYGVQLVVRSSSLWEETAPSGRGG